MNNFNNVEDLFERLATRNLTEADISILRNSLARSINQDVVQIGNQTAVNIGSAGSINIGNHITYQGTDAETIREILQSLREIERQRPLVSNSEALHYLRQQYPVRPGVPFQWQVLVGWLILSFVCLIALLFYQTSNSLQIHDFEEFIYYWFILFMVAATYGFLGIFLQRIFQYRWRFGEVRHYWIVWFFYPVITPFFLAVMMVFYPIRCGDRILPRFFRFW
ncbi:hypothetical protein [Limnofasciculus baicalensis]|uniref:Effector-associated domain-containing protein n=1 Tax=Limnofasciculus baicalensis BBK-W-15 TaxID=2699891 RepID=A0AAE3GSJ2_9CYAN|nr:hypothetical protein [Limnofasciculus baicalensis]MCP2729033.1 hypothetical protein [Limnofasciculus baicalensis BBK-W-15]